MEDVAHRAGVSVSTVSHVINGTRKVRPATVEAVRDAIRKTGYVPNSLAQALAGASTKTIGVAISALTNHYFAETVRVIESECARRGLMIFLADTHDDPDQELRVIKALHQRRVDGIILAPTAGTDRRALDYLKGKGIPSVLVDRIVRGEFDQVGVENTVACRELISHLIGHGHRRIGFVAGAPGISTSIERLEGYRDALHQASIPFDPALVCCGESANEPARRAVRELLRLDPRPTAIVASNNLMMIGAMHALRDAGIEVPAGMALVGFDDFDWAELFNPRLTVLAQPLEDIAMKAVELLTRRIARPDDQFEIVRLTPELRIRNSCGCQDQR
ncbi:LacI family DNA-binding transcriptional regulator [Acidiphilium sp.]|uniref:LacI family DNA-binding transcriptional regulator n=1 Tax=Acidiphilium sp. TaxID=527 RepID=UPI00258DD188|nr:LacI family DNA-binding transcriptional regulator [Acidiphilium sp.]